MPNIGGNNARLLQDHHGRQLERVSASRNCCATSAVLMRTVSDSHMSNEFMQLTMNGNNDDDIMTMTDDGRRERAVHIPTRGWLAGRMCRTSALDLDDSTCVRVDSGGLRALFWKEHEDFSTLAMARKREGDMRRESGK
ncbi:hypothetical protein E4U13_000874 [Claviceps humidiphila]|uniref:Uncharacterized protein n=1 Tax=Claviceps humidiphila TaxID=1294629 RepID=A0A9P7TX26_9HYPO|nr:hypothetical protein E4U13_000874 [Claviceps humidiphila]